MRTNTLSYSWAVANRLSHFQHRTMLFSLALLPQVTLRRYWYREEAERYSDSMRLQRAMQGPQIPPKF